jgi:cytidine deaminase
MNITSALIAAARRARLKARAKHSGFKVGAALETARGKVITGCNIENSTYGLTVCAERVAVWKALSEGQDRFRRIAVVADSDVLTPPCGPCRQILWEFCGDIEVVLANLGGSRKTYRLSELFPLPFDNRFLNKEKPRDKKATSRTPRH